MAVVATQIKKGQCIEFSGEKLIVLDLDHRTPGKGNAIILANCRSLQTNKTKTIRFASSDKVDVITVDRQKLEYSYTDGTGYFFMNPETYDTIELTAELLEDSKNLLIEKLSNKGKTVVSYIAPTIGADALYCFQMFRLVNPTLTPIFF